MPEATERPLYNLKAVVQKTGIPAASLRAWERRYGVLTPVRKANGHRLYPAPEIEKLLRIKALMAQGMAISQASQQVALMGEPPAPAAGEYERVRGEMIQALAGCDLERANHLFGEALDLFSVAQLCRRVLRTLLKEVKPWGRTYLRSKLGALLLHAPQQSTLPVALVLAPDLLDLEPLVVALFLTRQGYRVVYVEGGEAPEGLNPALVIDPRRSDSPSEQFFS